MSQEKDKGQKEDSVVPKSISSEHEFTHSDQPGPSRAESEPMLSSAKVSPDDKSKAQRAQSDTDLGKKASKTAEKGPVQEQRSQTTDYGFTMTDSMKHVVIWTMTSFFDWNPTYFIQMRGIMNVIHLILSVTCIILLSQVCKLSSFISSSSDHFFCDAPATFLFVSSCAAFFTATLYVFCCILSKKTSSLLFHTSFEVSYFALYFILLLTSSITLMITAISWDTDGLAPMPKLYGAAQAAATIGLINSIMYGVSALWFFISHRFYKEPDESEEEVP